ncbi:hypothetical protein FISHEDRAFT_78824 [Fistulina hepatica ATCC 64428]|uniref:Fungal STAND N-terminal Goodbye domain-containing protein n=1 Tax=Fistulina hepatica ATCC 64428 TaxID=1128425 RepID=A0A0D6ZZY2_9AGAR|nr:hypothetical protein FISHEDRAFT_78824 [Fistulina hepatica ATCC 64428]
MAEPSVEKFTTTFINVFKEIKVAVESIKVDERKCRILVNQCTVLIDALMYGSLDLQTRTGADFASKLEKCLTRLKDKTLAWSVLSPWKSFWRQNEICHGIEDFTQELHVMAMFYTNTRLEYGRQQQEYAGQQLEAIRQQHEVLQQQQ